VQLIKPTLLQYPYVNKEFCITTDASKQARGAFLTQNYNGTQLPVAYSSRPLTKVESNTNTTEQEYIYGKHFTVKTDHRPLTYLFSMTSPSSKLTSVRLDLEVYDFRVEYLKRKDNHIAHVISRLNIQTGLPETKVNRKIPAQEKIK